jgi:hypothetical protein
MTRPAARFSFSGMQFRNASAIALPYGSQVNTINVSESGAVFFAGLDWADNAIRRAILKQHLATGEGQHQARGWFTDDQMAVMDKRLGLPVRGV